MRKTTCPDCGLELLTKNLPQHRERQHCMDEVAIERAMGGDRPVRLSRWEYAEAARRMTERGYSSRVISDRLGIDQRTVHRIRARQTTHQHQESA